MKEKIFPYFILFREILELLLHFAHDIAVALGLCVYFNIEDFWVKLLMIVPAFLISVIPFIGIISMVIGAYGLFYTLGWSLYLILPLYCLYFLYLYPSVRYPIIREYIFWGIIGHIRNTALV